MGGANVRAMKSALRGDQARVREEATRVLREAADQRPDIAKRVAVHGVGLFMPSFGSCAGWVSPIRRQMASDRVSPTVPPPPAVTVPGASLFTGAVLDLHAGFNRGAMFAEFAVHVADGLFQLALAEPVGRYGARERARWRAAFHLAENGDPGPLEALMTRASQAPSVLKELGSNLHHFAWAFDVVERERPEVAAAFLSNSRRGRSSHRLPAQPNPRPSPTPSLDNHKS